MKAGNVRYLLREGVKNLWSNRTMSFSSVGVLISCLLLTGAAVLFSMNIQSAMKSVEGGNSIKVYCSENLPTLRAVQVGQEIQKLDNVKSCELILPDDAMKEVVDMLGDNGDLLTGIIGEDNFLPHTFKISLEDIAKYKETSAQIQSIAGVSQINNYSDVADKLTRLDKMVTTASLWIVILLSVVSLFIISNTIRVTMFSRRLEISIMKSVGATNWFVRVPFVVEGIIIGLVSGGLASLLLTLLYGKLTLAISNITLFNVVDISPITGHITALFMLVGMVFGALGGMFSIGRYLKKEGGDIVAW